MSVNDDEAHVERSRAPLLEHLTELRGRLFWCCGTLVVAFFIAFAYASQILDFLVHPWVVAGGMAELQARAGHEGGFFSLKVFENSLAMLRGMIGLDQLPTPRPAYDVKLIATAALETFLAKVKLAAFGAIILAFPMLAWQIYRFVAPGLYKRERHAFAPFLIAAPLLFVAGMALVYYVLLPFVGWFSLNQQILGVATVQLTPKIGEFLDLTIKLMLAFGLCFQLPVVLSLVALAGLVNAKQLGSFRRFAIVGVFVLAAVLTPPDPISQLSLAIPLILLYEVSVWTVWVIDIGRRRREAAESRAVV